MEAEKNIDPVSTTSFNHNTLGTKQKPLISNAQYKNLFCRAMDTVRTGEDPDWLLEQALKHFTLTKDQLGVLQYKIECIKEEKQQQLCKKAV